MTLTYVLKFIFGKTLEVVLVYCKRLLLVLVKLSIGDTNLFEMFDITLLNIVNII